MSSSFDLIKAIRSGKLKDVIAALDNGVPVELDDGKGNSGLPMAIACFMGHADIIRELALRGARINFEDNLDPISPLSMAVKGKKPEAVRTLIELGIDLPLNVDTGLSDPEIRLAKWKAQHFGVVKIENGSVKIPEPEEIRMTGMVGTDTGILDAELRRAIAKMESKK